MSRSHDEAFYRSFREQAKVAVIAATGLAEMIAAPERQSQAATTIADAGKRAGAIKKEAVRMLQHTWITPLDRHHIHELILGLDGITHLLDSTAARFRVFGVREPPSESHELACDMRAACEHVREATEILPKLSKATAPELLRLTDEIQVIERRADETHRQALVAIFDSGFDVPIILRWRDIVDRLEGATDLCQDVAMLLQAIVLENA